MNAYKYPAKAGSWTRADSFRPGQIKFSGTPNGREAVWGGSGSDEADDKLLLS